MKFLIIAALFALLLLLLYSKLYPYILTFKKILSTAKTIAYPPRGSGSDSTATRKLDKKLVRCVSCGTWVPAERAIGSRTGLAVYCSRECIEKGTNDKERKMAG